MCYYFQDKPAMFAEDIDYIEATDLLEIRECSGGNMIEPICYSNSWGKNASI